MLGGIIRRAERQHYQDALLLHRNNLKKSWLLIKEIINKKRKTKSKPTKFTINGRETDDSNEIANSFNEYFTNIGPTLDRKIPTTRTNPIQYIKQKCTYNIFLAPCTEHEINKTIDNLKTCSSGYDNLPALLIKENKIIFTPILMYRVNLSLTQGIFSRQLKIAAIIPIFKAGLNGNIANYRPISLLTAISKNYERIFCTRLSNFFDKHKILYQLQFGFRPKHSTQLAMITLLEQIISSLDKGHFTIGIFFGF